MASRVRSRSLSALAAGALLVAGCGDGDASAGAGAQDAPRSAAAAPEVDVAALPAEEVPARVLHACHGALVGVERFAARVTLADGGVIEAFGDLPRRLRAQWPDGAVQLLDGETARALADDGSWTAETDATALLRLRALHRLLDTATLGPLHRSIGCQRTGPRTFLLAQPGDLPWTLTLQPRALLVERLEGPTGAVQVLDHLRTSTTWIVRRARTEVLGECAIRFEAIDFAWDQSMFTGAERPAEAAVDADAGAPAPAPAGTLVVGAPARPTAPELTPSRALRWLVLPDPVDWEQRATTVQERLGALEARGQTMAGFAGLLREGERAFLVVPFRPDEGAAELAEWPADWDVRTFDAGNWLEIYPPSGELDQRIALGERQLRDAVQQRGLQPRGPVLAQPFLHLNEGAPTAEQARAPVVRVAVPVR
ncbi:MAG: hypothetical protein AB7O97_07545 [Planctomycetota bacterium]